MGAKKILKENALPRFILNTSYGKPKKGDGRLSHYENIKDVNARLDVSNVDYMDTCDDIEYPDSHNNDSGFSHMTNDSYTSIIADNYIFS